MLGFYLAVLIATLVVGAWLQARASYQRRAAVLILIALLSTLAPITAMAGYIVVVVGPLTRDPIQSVITGGLIIFGIPAFALFSLNRNDWNPGTSFVRRWAIGVAASALVAVCVSPFAIVGFLLPLKITDGP